MAPLHLEDRNSSAPDTCPMVSASAPTGSRRSLTCQLSSCPRVNTGLATAPCGSSVTCRGLKPGNRHRCCRELQRLGRVEGKVMAPLQPWQRRCRRSSEGSRA